MHPATFMIRNKSPNCHELQNSTFSSLKIQSENTKTKGPTNQPTSSSDGTTSHAERGLFLVVRCCSFSILSASMAAVHESALSVYIYIGIVCMNAQINNQQKKCLRITIKLGFRRLGYKIQRFSSSPTTTDNNRKRRADLNRKEGAVASRA